LEIPQSLTEHIIVERTLSPAPPQQPASVAPPASSNAMTLGPAATGVIRQEYVLDGVIELRSEILTWSLPSGGEDDRYYRLFVQELNDLLGLAYAEGTYWYPASAGSAVWAPGVFANSDHQRQMWTDENTFLGRPVFWEAWRTQRQHAEDRLDIYRLATAPWPVTLRAGSIWLPCLR